VGSSDLARRHRLRERDAAQGFAQPPLW
jgi:hypothetical protein